ncbi:MAG: phage distal tail protein [Paraclostridium sp.]
MNFNGNFNKGDVIVFDQEHYKVTLNALDRPSILELTSKRHKLTTGLNEYIKNKGHYDIIVKYRELNF